MPRRLVIRCARFCTAGLLISLCIGGLRAEIVRHETSGRVSLESRWHPRSAAYPGQRSHASGLVVEPEFYLEDHGGRSFNLAPFFRYDAGDPSRTHVDLREAYLLLFGGVANSEWELRLGVDRVFWGVTESRHLVNIVNQIDQVEHPYKEPKLGQPMAHLTFSGDWGTAEVFGLTYHRARTFPGRFGRLRFPFVVDNDMVSYESDAKQWHLDVAGRYSRSFGPLDLGMSVFDGTSRDPFLILDPDRSGEPAFVPIYEQIRQFGLDAQVTAGSWLFKLEAIRRTGARNRVGVEEDYSASTFGGEYTFYSVSGSAVDLTLLSEWNYDGRRQYATNIFQNDFFLAARIAFNDVQSTEILTSILRDADSTGRVLTLELNRRISDQWSLRLEAITFQGIQEVDLTYLTRRDSFVELNLIYNF